MPQQFFSNYQLMFFYNHMEEMVLARKFKSLLNKEDILDRN